jgi:hypothetical protein
MTSNLDKLIRKTEEKYLQALTEACTFRFASVHLPSHDQVHHRRVWSFAKMLLQQAAKSNIPISEADIERLIIAVFFHDQGMSESLSKEHGQMSRKACKEYFRERETPPGFEAVLDAVEAHDRKDYQPEAIRKNEFNLQKFLNIADDLDAFGVVGAYRYAEIYLLRSMAVNQLPDAVSENLQVRFQHFANTFASDSVFVKAQNQRYMAARNYFRDLNMQLKLVEYQPELFLGPMGVLNVIREQVIRQKRQPSDVCDLGMNPESDFYCSHFFERLKRDLTSAV